MTVLETGEANFPFDDTRRALAFALNAHDPRMPSPVMNREMAAAPVKTTRVQRKRIEEAWLDAGIPALIERASSRTPDRRPPGWWQKLKEPERAGFVLLELNKLDAAHRVVLQGLLTRSHAPCSCKRPCCSGWSVDLRWAAAVDETCRLLAYAADVLKQPGKKGLSTQPALRKLAVEQYYTGRVLTLTDLARVTDVTMVTAAKHRELIHAWLLATETAAWPEINALLEAAGIVGTNLEMPVTAAAITPGRQAVTGLMKRLDARRGQKKTSK